MAQSNIHLGLVGIIKRKGVTKIEVFSVYFILPFFYGCGGSGTIADDPCISSNYQQFKTRLQSVGIENISTYWNEHEALNWIYCGVMPLDVNETPESVFESKIINCHKGDIMMQDIFGGKIVYLDQVGREDHEIVLFGGEGNWSFLSFCGTKLDYIVMKATNGVEFAEEMGTYFLLEGGEYNVRGKN